MTNHGSRSCYVATGCRCRPCIDANTTYRNAHRQGVRLKTSRSKIRPLAKAAVARYGSIRATARMLGVPNSTLLDVLHSDGTCYSSVARKLQAAAKKANVTVPKDSPEFEQLRLPFEPVLRLLAYRGESLAELSRRYAERFGMLEPAARRRIDRLRAAGVVSIPEADRLAVAVGCHLDLVWEAA